MRNRQIALATISALAMAFTFSCGEGCYTANGSGPCSYEVETVAEISSSSSAPACNLYGEWIEITPATCDKKGVRIKICTSNPSNIETQEIPQNCVSSSSSDGGSSSSAPKCNSYGSWIEITPATCDKKGVETRICVGDPSNIEMQEKAQLEWGEWVVTKPASGTNPAEGERYCFNGNVKIGEETSKHLLICGGKPYDRDLEFCQDGTEIKKLCDGKTYNSTQFCDDRDKRVYNWVKIGGQVWMAENLNYDVSGSVCYQNSKIYCDTYGRMYNWNIATATGSAAICPSGWHLPNNDEWNELTNAVGSDAGTKLKATSGWNSCTASGSTYTCSDNYGFSALPGGYCNSSGSFGNAGFYGYWWSATAYNDNYAYYRRISNDAANVFGSNNPKTNLFSVRCVQD